MTSGLILHFDTKDINSYPGSGTVINDLSGNNRHSQIIGGVKLFQQSNSFGRD